MWTPQRSKTPEMLDISEPTNEDLAANLGDMATANRLMGSVNILADDLRILLATEQKNRPISMLDIGTGGGDIPLALATWFHHQETSLALILGDINSRVLAVAGESFQQHRGAVTRKPLLVQHEARYLPFARDSIDIITCCQTLHHLEEDSVIALLREMERVSRLGFVALDLRRSLLAYWSLRLAMKAFRVGNRLSKNDGPLSVLRAFNAQELAALAEAAEIPSPTIRQHRWQLSLLRVKEAGRGGAGAGPELRSE